MKTLETAKKKVQKAVATVVAAATLSTAPARPRSRDPWHFDDERKAAVNAGTSRRWIARRRGWLR